MLLTLAVACSDDGTGPGREQVASVSVTPDAQELEIGETYTLQVVAKDQRDRVLSGRTIAWATDRAEVAIVSATGVVTAISPGTTRVTASIEGKHASAEIEVLAPAGPIARILLSTAATEVAHGSEAQLAAAALDANGRVVPGAAFTWSSDKPEVATVSSSGRVAGVAPGVARITASVEGYEATAEVAVLPATSNGPVESVSLSTTAAALQEGEDLQLIATPLDALGRTVPGLWVQWTSSDPEVAYVAAGGKVYAVRHGTAEITARVHGKMGKVTIEVTADYAYELAYGAATPGNPPRMYALDLASGAPRLLLPEGVVPAEWAVGMPTPSPDGSRLAFVAVAQGVTSIYVINRNGTGLRHLAAGTKPAWSPDGQKIAYQYRSAETNEDVWVIDADGSNPVNLTADQGPWDQTWPSWSPRQADGSYRIAYAHFHQNAPNIWTMKADGSDKRQITNTGMDDQPAWSPDGSTIAFQRSGVGARIMLMNPDGGDLRGLGLPYWQRAPSWSPDGRLLAFVSGHQTPGSAEEIYTVRTDLTGFSVARRTWGGGYHGAPAWIGR